MKNYEIAICESYEGVEKGWRDNSKRKRKIINKYEEEEKRREKCGGEEVEGE